MSKYFCAISSQIDKKTEKKMVVMNMNNKLNVNGGSISYVHRRNKNGNSEKRMCQFS